MSDILELTLYELWRTDEAILLSTEPYRGRKQSWIGLDKIESIERLPGILGANVVKMKREVARKAGLLPRSEKDQ